VLAAYGAYVEACRLVRREETRKAEEAKRLADEKRPCRGCMARVVRGRKVPVGTVGTVFWMGEGQYGTRVGLKDSTGQVHWTAASNVERLLDGE
jgi:hypothetical protein